MAKSKASQTNVPDAEVSETKRKPGRPLKPPSDNPRHVRRKANKLQQDDGPALNTTTATSNESTPSAESIGLSDMPKRAEPEPEEHTYFCQNCKAPLTKGESKCPVCEVALDWKGL